jgi:predicted lactoylglutathione lyase
MAFFERLGFRFNPQLIADDIYAMLLTHAKFKTFTKKEIADATKSKEVLTALSFESKAKVDDLVGTALKAGGTESGDLMDYGFMYGRSFDDLDGHTWEIFWMDPNHVQKT